MEPKPISPVIVTFKALPGVRLQAIIPENYLGCTECRLIPYHDGCDSDQNPKGNCGGRNYIWREVGEK